MAQFDARRTEVLGRSASIIQRKTRSYLARRSFVLLQKSAMLIQAVCQVQLARHIYESMWHEAACLRIQKYLRMHIARKAYKDLCSSAICIQTGLHGMAARCELRLRKQIKAAIVIQSHCRKYLARVQYLDTEKAALTTQCAWRGGVARRELRKLKMAATNKLEKQVEELTWNLQLEKRRRADLEGSKNQENAKLQSALNDKQLQFKQTQELLSIEIERLKGLINSLEKKIGDTEKKYEETKKIGEERLKQALKEESKMIEMKTDMQRLVEKISDMENENQILWEHVIVENGINEQRRPTPVKKYGTCRILRNLVCKCICIWNTIDEQED
ncbi:myosin-6-like [Syzygium oleosum]|uniref:myosin-6-like n=1 Tax=Syzygium oleosum TaxID=219896 RepID=UPI0024B8E14A|nr:myosin-6-like [Syzygium oleosum]